LGPKNSSTIRMTIRASHVGLVKNISRFASRKGLAQE
jgi:hypothetical protein